MMGVVVLGESELATDLGAHAVLDPTANEAYRPFDRRERGRCVFTP